MHSTTAETLAKVPAITLGFWVIKILATTLGETGGDTVSMSMNLGYLTSTGIFMLVFVGAVIFQIKAVQFHPFIYWFTIIASTTVGTTMADYADRSLGIGYPGGSTLLLTLLLISLLIWHKSLGRIDVASVHTPRAETFYWFTIMFSQTLGTALGDWTAETGDLGYIGAAGIFSAFLMFLVLLYFFTKTNRVFLFWSAFILTRPLGAAVGDYLDKPVADGGLELSRYTASAVLIVVIVALVALLPQRAAEKSH